MAAALLLITEAALAAADGPPLTPRRGAILIVSIALALVGIWVYSKFERR